MRCLYFTVSIVTKRAPTHLFTVRAAVRTDLTAWFRDLGHPKDYQGFAPKTVQGKKTFLQVLDLGVITLM